MENLLKELKFSENGLIPAIAQDHATGEVLMMAWMNREALEKTLETKKVHYWSRSRQSLWLKGETSGHFQTLKSIRLDCDGDTLLLGIEQAGGACHTGNRSCFYREIDEGDIKEVTAAPVQEDKSAVMKEVFNVVTDRLANPKEGSYTNYLFTKGLDKILKKVGEESAEVIIAAKNKAADEIRYEVADLFYHIIVLLVERGMTLDDIYEELKGRR
jgi:phosphoribosyl-ATP pyrophosphohydrolase/phosphoribosyl-AMP cyclohydrolase